MSTPRPVLWSGPQGSSGWIHTVYWVRFIAVWTVARQTSSVRRRHASVHRGASRRRGLCSNCAAWLHQPCQELVHVPSTAVKRCQNRTDLVRFRSQSCRYPRVNWTCKRASTPFILPHPSAFLACCSTRNCRCQSTFARSPQHLLQLCSGRSSSFHYWAT